MRMTLSVEVFYEPKISELVGFETLTLMINPPETGSPGPRLCQISASAANYSPVRQFRLGSCATGYKIQSKNNQVFQSTYIKFEPTIREF